MNYSIKDLAGLSGIKAHAIRIWEKRYGLFQPTRTDTNIRKYSAEDLKKILNVALLNRFGYKISVIAQMSAPEMEGEVLKLHTQSNEHQMVIDRMILSMIELNEKDFESIFLKLLVDYDFENIVIKFIFPLLEKIGILWQTSTINPAQEHFISNIIRRKIIVATDKLRIPDGSAGETFLLFLPEEELHEIGLLFANYLIRKKGLRSIYLGQSVPYNDLISVQKRHQANYMVTSFVNTTVLPKPENYLQELTDDFPAIKILLIGGKTINIDEHGSRITAFYRYNDLSRFLDNLDL